MSKRFFESCGQRDASLARPMNARFLARDDMPEWAREAYMRGWLRQDFPIIPKAPPRR